MKKNVLLLAFFLLTSSAIVAQMRLDPEKIKVIDYLESKKKAFQMAKNDSIFASENSDLGYSSMVITRGDQADDIEEQIFKAKLGAVVGPFDGEEAFYLLKIIGMDSLPRTKVKTVSFFPRGEYTSDTAKFSKHIEKYIDHIKKGKEYGKMIIKDEASVGMRNKGTSSFWQGQTLKANYDIVMDRKVAEPYVTKVGNEIQVLYVVEEKRNAAYRALVVRLMKKVK